MTSTERPNILLITADQWRADCLSAVGHPLVQTPNLDKLASEGVLFEQHYAGAAPCSPARACLYTGLYQMNNRVCINGSPLDQRHDTLALAFRRLGYDPTLFGYTDQSQDPRGVHANDPKLKSYEGLLPGFNWRISIPDHQYPFLSWLKEKGYDEALSGVNMCIPQTGVDDPPQGGVPRYRAEHTETAYLVDEFRRWLSEQTLQSSRQPDHRWFAHVSFLRPHPPFTVPAPYDTLVSADDVADFFGSTDPDVVAAMHPLLEWIIETNSKDRFIPGAQGLAREWTQQDLKQIAATYFGMVAEVDAQIGRMVEALKSNGTYDNTLIVFTSDHGEQLGDHTLLGKHGFFDSSYHIPLIIRDPAATTSAGSRMAEFTECIDIFPTLLARMGADIPQQLDGKSLQPVIETGVVPSSWRNAAHWEFDFRNIPHNATGQRFNLAPTQCNMSVLRRDDVKYAHFAGLPPLLFDLTIDPEETRNVAGDPGYQALQLECAQELLSWRAEHLDQSLALSALTDEGLASVPRK
ncbi:phosphonate monoester hydrolase [Chromatiales bacterium (ex Bugula neritina AB1)]|nr:phosphonate monoester hydrolase [Chromatiales bacterium (ex Bugula neritina AB1)]